MKSHVENITNLTRKLNVEVPATLVNTTFQRVFQNIQKDVTLKGFRKGKAPLEKIKSLYGERIKEDVAQDLISTSYGKALKEHDLFPMGYPEFEFDLPAEGKDFNFTASFDVRPEVVLKKYEGLAIQKEKWTLEESLVEKSIENIQNHHARFEPLTEDRPAQLKDVAIIDFEGKMNGATLPGGSGTDHKLELGSQSFIEGFEEGIVGMQKGESKELNLKFPENYHEKSLSAQSVTFKVTLKSIETKVLPELTESFIKTLGSYENLESLKAGIRKDLEDRETTRIQSELKERTLKALIQENPVEVPASIMKEQKKLLVENFKKRMQDQGVPKAEMEDYVSKWDADFDKTAADMAQGVFLVTEIAKKHDLQCKQEDMDSKFAEFAVQYKIPAEMVKSYYEKENRMDDLQHTITQDKVIDFVLSKAAVTEVPSSDLADKH